MKRRESPQSSVEHSEEEDASYSAFHTPVKGLIKEMRHKRVTRREFEESTLNRFEWYEQRKQEKLLVHKKQALLSKLQEHTQTPQINIRKSPHPPRNPLVSRLDEILESRKVRIESKKDRFVSKDEREAKECTFKPTINNNGTNRSLNDLFKWQEQRKMRLMEKSVEHDYQKKECSFTPEISKNSRILMERRTHNKDFQKVEDRLIGYLQKAKEKQFDIDETETAQQGFMNQSHLRSQSLINAKPKKRYAKSPNQSRGKLDTFTLANHTGLMDSSANLFVTEQEQATFRCADMHSNSTKGMQFSFKKAPKSKRSSENRKQRLQVKEDVPEDDEQITVYQRTQHLDRDYTPTRPIEASPSSEEPVCPSGRKKVGHGVPKAPNLSAANLQLGNSKENICPASKSKKSPMKKQTQPNVNKSTPFGATDDSFARSRSNLKHLSSQSTQQDASSSHHQSSLQQEDSLVEQNLKVSRPGKTQRVFETPVETLKGNLHMQSVLSSERDRKTTPDLAQTHKNMAASPIKKNTSVRDRSANQTAVGQKGSLNPSTPAAVSHMRTSQTGRRTPGTSVSKSVRANEPKDSEQSRSRKNLVNEKYTVKVRQQVIDCKDIQDTIVGGETTSMLENLKRLNTNLKKFNQLECIIKDAKPVHERFSPASFGAVMGAEGQLRGSLDGVQHNHFLKQLEQGHKPQLPNRPGTNSFIELFAGNALSPIN